MSENEPEEQKPEIVPLDSVDALMLMFMVENPKITQTELADKVGYSRSGLQKRMRNPNFKLALKYRNDIIEKGLKTLYPKAIKRLDEGLDMKRKSGDADVSTRLDIAKFVVAQNSGKKTEGESHGGSIQDMPITEVDAILEQIKKDGG